MTGRFDALRLRRAIALLWAASPGLLAAGLGLALLQGVLPLGGIYLLKLLVDAATAAAAGTAAWAAVYTLLGWTGALFLATALANAAAAWLAEARAQTLADAVTERLHERSVAVDLAFYEDPRYYDTLHRAQQEAPYRPGQLAQRLHSVVASLAGLVGVAALLLTLHPGLAVALAAATFPAAAARVRHARRLEAWRRGVTPLERRVWYLNFLLTRDAHAKEVRLLDLGDELRRRWRDTRARLRGEQLALAGRRAGAEAAAQAWAVLVIFASFAFVVWQASTGAATVGDLVLSFAALQRGLSWLRDLLTSAAGLYEDSLFLSHLFELLDLAPAVVSPAAPRPVPRPLRQGLAVEGLTFRYPDAERPVLVGVDLVVAPGEIVAVVGANGSGKTTLMKLLCRLYDPQEGRIALDGIDLRALDLRELRRQLAPLFQDFVRYQLTARDNVALGDLGRSPDEPAVARAAEAAAVRATVERLPHGWDTQLGRWFEAGHELSVGQWQRLALARTIFREAPILLLDEPTSALDAAAEAELGRRLRGLVGDRLALVVSHHPAAVVGADRVVVLAEGRVVEQGSPAELLARDGEYARLYRAGSG